MHAKKPDAKLVYEHDTRPVLFGHSGIVEIALQM